MSFILDALKKSESERHRQSGPVLMDVRIAPPRRRIPSWAWVIAAVLLVNLAVLAWILWLSPAQRAEPLTPPLAAAPAPGNIPGALPAAIPPPAAPAVAAPPAPLPADPAGNAASPAIILPAPAAAPVAAPPVPVPAPQPAQPPSAAQPAIDVAALPRVSDMLAAGVSLPDLQLTWHVYDAAPQGRYVLLNGARLREGEFTADGVRVVAIAPTGVVVEWRGRRMFLSAGR